MHTENFSNVVAIVKKKTNMVQTGRKVINKSSNTDFRNSKSYVVYEKKSKLNIGICKKN